MKRFKWLTIISVCSCLLLISLGYAEEPKIDMGMMSCADFFNVIAEVPELEPVEAVAWLDGYVAGATGDTTINPAYFKQFTLDLIAYCMNQPQPKVTKILTAAKKVDRKETQAGVDVRKITCVEFFERVANNDFLRPLAILWLDGYLSGVSGDKTVAPQFFDAFVLRLMLECQDNPRASILDAAKKVGLERKKK